MVDKNNTHHIPDQPGVYIFKQGKKPIYIGKSVNLRTRVLSHMRQALLDKKERAIIENSDSIEFITTLSNYEALILESQLIQKHKPKYNVHWKDDKNYLYIKIDTHNTYPKLTAVRKENDGHSKYFGPFKSTYMTETLLYELRKVVPYCTHKGIGKRGCFYSKIGFCNPCPNVIEHSSDPKTKELLTIQYRKNINKAIQILSGKTHVFTKSLEKQIKKLSDQEKYEEAIPLRNRLLQFSLFLDRRTLHENLSKANIDVDALQVELSEFLKEYFNYSLGESYRVECYDISNLYGKQATGSMVVYEDGLFAKKEYRKFKVAYEGIADIKMMKEVLKRRLEHDEWKYPDILILDGGTPQLREIHEFFKENLIPIPLISIAKRPDRILLPIHNFRPVPMKKYELLFRLIQSLRDESHRFAKKYHVHLRDSQAIVRK